MPSTPHVSGSHNNIIVKDKLPCEGRLILRTGIHESHPAKNRFLIPTMEDLFYGRIPSAPFPFSSSCGGVWNESEIFQAFGDRRPKTPSFPEQESRSYTRRAIWEL